MSTRKKSYTSHLLIRRMYNGKLFTRYHSYNTKSEINEIIDKLRQSGKRVRVHKSPLEKLKYTIYTRGK